MIISVHFLVRYAKKDYLFTQKTEAEHFLLKIHFCEIYAPLGGAIVEKRVLILRKIETTRV